MKFTFNNEHVPALVFLSDIFSTSRLIGSIWPLTNPEIGTWSVADNGPDLQQQKPMNFSFWTLIGA